MISTILNPQAEISFASANRGRAVDRVRLHAFAPSYLRIAAFLVSRVRPAQPILLALPNSPELLHSIWACLAVGIPFCIIHPDRAGAFLDKTVRSDFPTELVPGFVIGDAGVEAHALRSGVDACSAFALADLAADRPPELPPPCEPGRVAYYQLTSGSSGPPKAVPVTWAMLLTNIEQMSRRCDLHAGDKLVLWVPMSHDMGLISWLALQAAGARMRLMETQAFVRSPLSWLSHLTEFEGTVSAAPAFALRVAAALAKRRDSRFNLSALRVLWVGGEPVFPRVVEEFVRVLSSSGLRPEAIHPTYGMAEAVVGVSTKRSTELPKSIWVSAASLNGEGKVRLAEREARGATAIMSCGGPVQNLDVEVWPLDGNVSLGEGQAGRIMIRGPNVVARYAGMDDDKVDGWRDTGDTGFVHGGEIYIVGRSKDVLSRGGVKVHAEQAEDAVRSALGDSIRRVAAFSDIDHSIGAERIVVVCETGKAVDDIRGRVSATVIDRCGITVDVVLLVERGGIPLTSSGKIRRDELRERYRGGKAE